jgi:hypothetical protein
VQVLFWWDYLFWLGNKKIIKMKRILFLFLFIANFDIAAQVLGHCDFDAYKLKALSYLPKGFTLLKSYKINGMGCRRNNGAIFILSKNTTYMLKISSKDGGFHGLVATLYDAKYNEIATSQLGNKLFNGFTYQCKKTGVYYISFTFKDSQIPCAAAVLGFKR